jgi:uncharacterized protein
MAVVAAFAVLALGSVALRAAEVMPPAPQDHFNDYAELVRPEVARQLNAELAQFERTTSNQIAVAIFSRMQSDSSVEDYTVRVAERWGVGGKARDNGAVLFVFQESHDIRIVTGYGLEGALPDALCKRIIESEIVPRFQAGDFSGGVTAGVHAMMAAARGEYRGAGATAAERRGSRGSSAGLGGIGVLIVLMILFGALRRASGGTIYGRGGRRQVWIGRSRWGGWGGGGWGGGGGWSGGGGGTFSGGGGSFGGGGAGGKW